MAKGRAILDVNTGPVGEISRTRRAALVAEFEGDLKIDHKARAKAAADARRWIRIKTFIVWTIALMFFAIACQKLWIMAQYSGQPFSMVKPAWMIDWGL